MVVIVGTGSGGPYAPFGDKACRISTSACLTSRICPGAFHCFLCLRNRETDIAWAKASWMRAICELTKQRDLQVSRADLLAKQLSGCREGQ